MTRTKRISVDPKAPARSLRLAAGRTQAEIAIALGVTQKTVSLWESAGPRLRLDTLGRIAYACGAEPDLACRLYPSGSVKE